MNKCHNTQFAAVRNNTCRVKIPQRDPGDRIIENALMRKTNGGLWSQISRYGMSPCNNPFPIYRKTDESLPANGLIKGLMGNKKTSAKRKQMNSVLNFPHRLVSFENGEKR
jgi:hypothetical protein